MAQNQNKKNLSNINDLVLGQEDILIRDEDGNFKIISLDQKGQVKEKSPLTPPREVIASQVKAENRRMEVRSPAPKNIPVKQAAGREILSEVRIIKAREIKETPKPKEALKIAPPQKEELLAPVEKIIPPAIPPVRKPAIDQAANQVIDVKFSPKLVGPKEELARLSLVDFRRLSRDPLSATGKIMDKINLLDQESFQDKIDGIRAYEQSEIYKTYLAIGRESLKTGRAVGEVIRDWQGKGKEVLSEEEFKAILELNKSLKF